MLYMFYSMNICKDNIRDRSDLLGLQVLVISRALESFTFKGLCTHEGVGCTKKTQF